MGVWNAGGLSAGEGSGLRTQTKTQPQPTPLPQYPTLTGAALMKSLPIALMSIDDLMFAKGTLTGGAVAAAAQLAHMGSDNSGVSQSRQVGYTFVVFCSRRDVM